MKKLKTYENTQFQFVSLSGCSLPLGSSSHNLENHEQMVAPPGGRRLAVSG